MICGGHQKLDCNQKAGEERGDVLRRGFCGDHHKYHENQRKNRAERVGRRVDKLFDRRVVDELILLVEFFQFVGVFWCFQRYNASHRDIVSYNAR